MNACGDFAKKLVAEGAGIGGYFVCQQIFAP
jgi:hypothetical protein